MKLKQVVVLVAVSVCFAQRGYQPISGELRHYWYTADPISFLDIEDFDENLLPERVSQVKITGIEEDGVFTIYLIGVREGKGAPLFLASGLFTEDHNMAKSWAYYEGGEIHLWFQMPFSAAYTEGRFVWDVKDGTLVSTGYERGDTSSDALELAASYMDAGKIAEAAEELNNIMYPDHYFVPEETTARLLRAANTAALEESDKGRYGEALDVIQSVSGFYNGFPDVLSWVPDRSAYLESLFSEYMEISEFAEILNNYAFYLEKTGSFDEAYTVLDSVLKLDRHRTVAYLNIADVMWAQGRLAESGGYYNNYRLQMVAAGLADRIPGRVLERARTL
jgi:tetratricopeptide (TPR) repeat protein